GAVRTVGALRHRGGLSAVRAGGQWRDLPGCPPHRYRQHHSLKESKWLLARASRERLSASPSAPPRSITGRTLSPSFSTTRRPTPTLLPSSTPARVVRVSTSSPSTRSSPRTRLRSGR